MPAFDRRTPAELLAETDQLARLLLLEVSGHSAPAVLRAFPTLVEAAAQLPIENIQDILGHSSPVITKVLYVGGSEKMQRSAPNASVTCLPNDRLVGVTLGSLEGSEPTSPRSTQALQ